MQQLEKRGLEHAQAGGDGGKSHLVNQIIDPRDLNRRINYFRVVASKTSHNSVTCKQSTYH